MGKSYGSAKGRWEGIGPYYAMFPVTFADEVIRSYSSDGQKVIDPFAGRGTSLFAAAVAGRLAYGVEITSVGWVYGQAKLHTACQTSVEATIHAISMQAKDVPDSVLGTLPEFFHSCYSRHVLQFLVAARDYLDWRGDPAGWTTMAIILVYLHGKRGESLSNQMRQSKAMSPNYSVRWWKKHGLTPPDIDPEAFLMKRVGWRYRRGKPSLGDSIFIMGDSCTEMETLSHYGPFDLMMTSPPYLGVTNYHYDQWLRLWMLGDPPCPTASGERHQGKFESVREYRALLSSVFTASSRMMAPGSTVYVRTDARPATLEATRQVLGEAFRDWHVTEIARPYARPTQTALYGDKTDKPGEVDIILKDRETS